MALRENYRNLGYSEMTQEERDRYNLEMYIWDAFRDVNGIRPRFLSFESMSTEELERMAEQLSEEIGAENDRRDAQIAELQAARQDPNCYVWLSTYGQMVKDNCPGDLDENEPDYWEWGRNPELPKVTFFQLAMADGH